MPNTQKVGDKTITWHPVVPPQYYNNDDWVEGARLSGFVEEYSPLVGETDYNDKECGFLDLVDFTNGTLWRLCLDKVSLIDQVKWARPEPGMPIGIKCLGDIKSAKTGNTYKKFEVFKGTVEDITEG